MENKSAIYTYFYETMEYKLVRDKEKKSASIDEE